VLHFCLSCFKLDNSAAAVDGLVTFGNIESDIPIFKYWDKTNSGHTMRKITTKLYVAFKYKGYSVYIFIYKSSQNTTISDGSNMLKITCFGPYSGPSSGCPWNSQSHTLGVLVFGGTISRLTS
jgi:hypothetical protein